jgi:lipopolysaccharide/colanic/teichoic acid biosynthesis glycosyltransferase
MKRAFDVMFSAAALWMTSPILAVAALAVKLDSPGPAFFAGPRVGKDGQVFRILKLRTMVVGSQGQGPSVTARDDPRITNVGRFLRSTKLDELPQLVNVLKGDMSLVGPRPEHPRYVMHYTDEQRRVLQVRPGITGPTAIAFVDEESVLDGDNAEADYLLNIMPRKLSLDQRYIQTASLPGDVMILAKTLATVAVRLFSRRAA